MVRAMALLIYRSKPNPIGKEGAGSGIPGSELLLGEWVDLKNIGEYPIRISTIRLFHMIFDHYCQTTGRTESLWEGSGKGILGPQQVIRIFTGSRSDEQSMSQDDMADCDWCGFAERDRFVLNNRCGDRIIVAWQDAMDIHYKDAASYTPNPPEGVVLYRVEDSLICTDKGTPF